VCIKMFVPTLKMYGLCRVALKSLLQYRWAANCQAGKKLIVFATPHYIMMPYNNSLFYYEERMKDALDWWLPVVRWTMYTYYYVWYYYSAFLGAYNVSRRGANALQNCRKILVQDVQVLVQILRLISVQVLY